jgi:hypothetical protein
MTSVDHDAGPDKVHSHVRHEMQDIKAHQNINWFFEHP